MYPLVRDTLRALEKQQLTVHLVPEWLTALGRRAGRLKMAFRRRGVVDLGAEEGAEILRCRV